MIKSASLSLLADLPPPFCVYQSVHQTPNLQEVCGCLVHVWRRSRLVLAHLPVSAAFLPACTDPPLPVSPSDCPPYSELLAGPAGDPSVLSAAPLRRRRRKLELCECFSLRTDSKYGIDAGNGFVIVLNCSGDQHRSIVLLYLLNYQLF